MELVPLLSAILVTTAFFAWVNLTVLRLPTTIGVSAIMTWGGLRGGSSIALALSIPLTLPERDALVTITYVVVVFSILGQGLTIGRLVARLSGGARAA